MAGELSLAAAIAVAVVSVGGLAAVWAGVVLRFRSPGGRRAAPLVRRVEDHEVRVHGGARDDE